RLRSGRTAGENPFALSAAAKGRGVEAPARLDPSSLVPFDSAFGCAQGERLEKIGRLRSGQTAGEDPFALSAAAKGRGVEPPAPRDPSSLAPFASAFGCAQGERLEKIGRLRSGGAARVNPFAPSAAHGR